MQMPRGRPYGVVGRAGLLLATAFLAAGCAASGTVGLANGALTGALAGIAPTITVEQILEQYALYHNLKVQLEMIDATGIVTTTTQTPIVITGTPLTPVAPTAPVVTPPPPPVTTTPVPPPSTGSPIVTPNVRHRHRSADFEQMGSAADFEWDRWGRPVRVDR